MLVMIESWDDKDLPDKQAPESCRAFEVKLQRICSLHLSLGWKEVKWSALRWTCTGRKGWIPQLSC